ncbi:MAG: class I SAM-dependent methyltransferase [Burkholderiaceae bacterium]|nr:class I SAM-dependent methyltransferase [Burkholderiaceae bacterium]
MTDRLAGTAPGAAPAAASGASAPLAPHQPLTEYYADESSRAQWVRRVFDATAPDYDRVEWLMAFGSGPWYRRRALARAGLGAGMRVLDVGTGTGLTAAQAVTLIGDPALLTGVDPSPGMLANARLPAGVRVLEGRAEQLPVDAAQYDFLSMGFALRHVSDLARVFGEFHRALKPGGRVCVLEITRPRSARAQWWLKQYMRRVVPLMARLVGRTRDMPELMRYYWDTIEACVPPDEVMAALRAAGFADVSRHVELGIFSEYTGTVRSHAAQAGRG